MGKRYQIIIHNKQHEISTIECSDTNSLLEAMQHNQLAYPSDCGGRGACGRCRIQLIKGELDITIQDRKVFNETELLKGYRLSCKAYPKTDCTIQLLSDVEQNMEVITWGKSTVETEGISENERQVATVLPQYAIAIDLGTTTVAVGLINRVNGDILNMYTAINPQRAYGADVISRIKASNEGNRQKLRETIVDKLQEGICHLLQTANIDIESLTMVAIAGNTTMGHLLLGYSCETLGVYPFTPVNCSTIKITLKDILRDKVENRINTWTDHQYECVQNIPVVILPGISAFVGGDITAGLSYCGFADNSSPSLFLDLGTNGEMAIGNKDKILVTSTAAGPAFEGGNISCGVGSISGAISHVSLNGEKLQIETIENKLPIGICGTGLVDSAAELLHAGILDGTGLLIDKYFESGFPFADVCMKEDLQKFELLNNRNSMNAIILTQKDIRELQLAKAAIRAGIEILMKNCGLDANQIDKVYLAGGFGYKMDINKAVAIGLLPEELKEKIVTVGNSSFAGAIRYLTNKHMQKEMDQIISVSEEIHLSNQDDFQELYIKNMSFYDLDD